MRSIAYVMTALLALMLSACQIEPPLPTAPAADATTETVYRLGSGDKFRLNVFNEPNLSGGEYSVNGEGDVSLPLVGPVHVGGLTMREAEAAITARYADGFIASPKVNIDVIAFRPFYILGEVNQPGEFPYADGLTVLNAIAKAGGFTYRAERYKVYITRSGSTQEVLTEITPSTKVLPGDTVRVVERFF